LGFLRNSKKILFETELIQFNLAGEITVYPNEILDFTPVYNFDNYANGSYSIETTIA